MSYPIHLKRIGVIVFIAVSLRVVSYPIHLKPMANRWAASRRLRVVSYPIHLKLYAGLAVCRKRLRVVSYPIHLKPLSSQLKHFQWLESSVISNPSQTTMTTPDRLTKNEIANAHRRGGFCSNIYLSIKTPVASFYLPSVWRGKVVWPKSGEMVCA